MNREQYLFCKLAEEAGEIVQIAMKTQQFGQDEIMPGQPFTNGELCHREIDDLMAIIEILNKDYGFGYVQDRDRIIEKKEKVNFYAKMSVSFGQVEG